MRKLLIWTCTALLSGLLTGTACWAQGQDADPAQVQDQTQAQAQGAPQEPVQGVEAPAPGTVPEAQIHTYEQREAMKQRRDELMKMRAQSVQGQ